MATPSKTIIVAAVDGSAASRRAIDVALSLADRGETLDVVHAIDPTSVLLPIAEGALVDTGPMLESLQSNGTALCDAALEKARARGIDATSIVIEGTPADSIVRFAAEAGAGMIVVGTHARTGLSKLLNGSVAEAILRTSPVPVVVAHADDNERSGPIALAFDASAPAMAAFHFALRAAVRRGKALRLIYVRSETEAYPTPPFFPMCRRDADRAGVALETSICSGDVTEAIVSAADFYDCSAIVVGTHGRNALQRVVQRSIANKVVESAKVPVIVVRSIHERTEAAATASGSGAVR